MRYIAVDRETLRQLLFEDGSLSDLLLSAFVERRELLQQRQGIDAERAPREEVDLLIVGAGPAGLGAAVYGAWLEPGVERHIVRLEEGNEIAARSVLLATGAEYRRLPVASGSPSSAAETLPGRPRSGWRGATPSSPSCIGGESWRRRCRNT